MEATSLRIAALCPHDPALAEVIVTPGATGPRKSWTDTNPKMAAILALAEQWIRQGEQLISGSPFRAFSEALHRRFSEADSSLPLDGRIQQERRGELAKAFKQKRWAVMVAGATAMAEGHSLECCSHIITPADVCAGVALLEAQASTELEVAMARMRKAQRRTER